MLRKILKASGLLTTGVSLTFAGIALFAAPASAHCAVNAGSCDGGHCTVNAGDCDGGYCYVNAGRCTNVFELDEGGLGGPDSLPCLFDIEGPCNVG